MSKASLTALVVLAVLQIVLSQSPNGCGSIYNSTCLQDSDCACGSLICNYNRRCLQSSFLDRIIRGQPCYPVFKSKCSTNADCPCIKTKLICEENECVKAKRRQTIYKQRFFN